MSSTTSIGILALLLAALSPSAPCQLAGPSPSVEIRELAALMYPPLARQARISGTVEIAVVIAPDGTVISANVLTGHPMLKEAALENLRHSQFACRGCSSNNLEFSVFYDFVETVSDDCCNAFDHPSKVTVNPEIPGTASPHVRIEAEAACLCDPAETVEFYKVRSAKCLYLWKCGKRLHQFE